jgi:hypothetical protein
MRNVEQRLAFQESLNYLRWSVEVSMKPMARSVIALALAISWTPCNLWAQQSETELLKQARVTKHRAKKTPWLKLSVARSSALRLKKRTGC